MGRRGTEGTGVDLSEEARRRLVAELRGLFAEEFDMEISEYRAGRVLDHTIRSLGPRVYNRAVADCAAYMTEAVSDLQAVVHAGEPGDFKRGGGSPVG